MTTNIIVKGRRDEVRGLVAELEQEARTMGIDYGTTDLTSLGAFDEGSEVYSINTIDEDVGMILEAVALKRTDATYVEWKQGTKKATLFLDDGTMAIMLGNDTKTADNYLAMLWN